MKQEDPTKYAPELFIPEEELVFEINSEAELKTRKFSLKADWDFLKDKKYVIEPRDDEAHKRVKVTPADANLADRRYKAWFRSIRKLGNWRPKKKVQKTDILNNEPGIALVNKQNVVERYNLHWVHDHAKATTESGGEDN